MLLAHPKQTRIITIVQVEKNQAIKAALQGWSGTCENLNSKGVAGLTSIHPLKEAPWYLAAHYPLAEAYAPLQRAKAAFVIILLLSTLFASVAVWLSMQPVVHPLQQLTSHLEQLGNKGGDERQLPVHSQDEIGRLSVVFNALLQELDDDATALEESAEMYRIVTEFTNEVSIWQLENGDIRYISPNCLEAFGTMAAEFYAEPALFDRLIHPDDRMLWNNHG